MHFTFLLMVAKIPYLCVTFHSSGVEQACCEFLTRQLDSTNCLGIRKFAETHACTGLLTAATDFCSRHFKEVVHQEEYVTLSEDEVLDLMRRDDLEVSVYCNERYRCTPKFLDFWGGSLFTIIVWCQKEVAASCSTAICILIKMITIQSQWVWKLTVSVIQYSGYDVFSTTATCILTALVLCKVSYTVFA